MIPSDETSKPFTFAILIGLVSTEDGDRIFETLGALRSQEGSFRYEVLLADRRQDAVSARIRAEYPEVRLLPCPIDASLPKMRTTALDCATGEYVVVTEDHCVPARDWLVSIHDAFSNAPPATKAVGGCVENGVRETALDWATFFCEYSGLVTPVHTGLTTALPGMNVAYRRSELLRADRSLLTSGFWETTLHPALVLAGGTLYSSNSIRLEHKKKFSFGLFARQRFLYSRYYAGRRFARRQYWRRWAAAVLTIALPGMLMLRIIRDVFVKRRLHAELIRAIPSLSIFVVIWAVGEMVGYLMGPGDALAKIE